ncbi:MAG: terminase small subunit [Romboutsia timonensis]|uniref:terminase small subunit n=1 Tax=Romboutsia timonensis TaxID=1776391 RepID=UPI0039905F39
MSTLNDRQRAFADYYIESLNAEQSAIRAGYSEKYARGNAHKLVANSCIKNYIEERMKEIESDRIAKAEEVLAFLSASLRGEVLEEVVSTESIEGMIKPVILKKQLSAKDRIKAAELLGKRYALFTEKVDLEGNVGVTIIDDIGTLEDA